MADIGDRVDVVIVGAGLAGIAAAHALRTHHPDKSFLVLDALDGHGGTWRVHRYPGVRSDSDLFTYGFRFKPWRGAPVASGAQILEYMREAIEENELGDHFRFRCRITGADWDGASSLWRIDGVRGDDAASFSTSCTFLWMCQGYYRYNRGYTPDWPGMDSFEGEIVHPQHWPEDFDHRGRRVVVIGSGATAATLVPALSQDAAHVTMLQRSPTYFSLAPNRHPLADTLRQLGVDDAIVHDIMRRKITFDQNAYFNYIMANPQQASADLLATLPSWLSGEDVARHFTPAYHPWQQRVALTPNGELFEALRNGTAAIVTDRIATFTPGGMKLESGETLDADIVVTATGFDLSMDGDIAFSIDGIPLDFGETVSYRGIMFSGVPNLARATGYLRLTSWTLRVELIADLVCRMLARLDDVGAASVEVCVPPPIVEERQSPRDTLPFTASYARRGMKTQPANGPTPDWQAREYWVEKDELGAIDLSTEIFAWHDAIGNVVRRDMATTGMNAGTDRMGCSSQRTGPMDRAG